jgi:ABC-2 type transport system ATP-binding protein
MTITVRVDGVTKKLGRRSVVDNVTFVAGPGITGLLGPNGAGKTTLLRMMATVLAPDAGRLTLLGLDPQAPDDRVELRRRMGYVPQEPGYYRHFSAFEFVDYLAILKEHTQRRARHDEVRRVLAAVGLEREAAKKIKALSGGMRRRVALAQALLGEPQLLVLDEPTAGLDPEQRFRFRELISTLGEDRTVLVSTHQTDDVAALCSQVVVLDQGRVAFDGTIPALAATATGRVWIASEREPSAVLSWRSGDGSIRNVGDPPANATLVPPSIEDAYLLLVRQPAVAGEDGAAA